MHLKHKIAEIHLIDAKFSPLLGTMKTSNKVHFKIAFVFYEITTCFLYDENTERKKRKTKFEPRQTQLSFTQYVYMVAK